MTSDHIVLGGGVAGLACAQVLAKAGADVLVLDRADKPGGRCATRIVEGRTADYGPLFLHGDDPAFLEAVREAAGDGAAEGWPHRVLGSGSPCQPEAFSPWQERLALSGGVNTFARSLATGLRINLRAQAVALAVRRGVAEVVLADGERHLGRSVVLALALEQTLPFLRGLPREAEIDAALALLGMFSSVPCLTVVAGWEEGAAVDWDMRYPESGPFVLIGNESSKRPGAHGLTLVLQATPRWSRIHLEEPRETWSAELLREAGGLLGIWAARPDWLHAHRWRYARLDRGDELATGLTLDVDGVRICLAGDLYSPGGGVQAAWRSGRQAAALLSS